MGKSLADQPLRGVRLLELLDTDDELLVDATWRREAQLPQIERFAAIAETLARERVAGVSEPPHFAQ